MLDALTQQQATATYQPMPPAYHTISQTYGTNPSKNWKRGMRVVLLSGRGLDSTPPANPEWGNPDNIAGTIEQFNGREICVVWDNGFRNIYDLARPSFVIEELSPSVDSKPKKKKEKEFTFDSTKLDALVIKDEVKFEIVAVLKQHHNAQKLFEEWGLAEVIQYGRGMTLMFYGKPGTGKTWGAHCIAKSLNRDLLTVDATNIQTSEPGGANRNIKNAFATAKKEGKVLFLDECDSLITVRNEVGMILSSEINTLLTEIEKFEGVCILSTNRIGNMDEALERRIALIVEFPEPDYHARLAIWGKMIPKKLPVSKDVKFEKIAEEKLTGGQIKNAVLQAARLAIAHDSKEVTLDHFSKAIERIHKSRALMGKGSLTHRARVVEDYTKGMS